MQANSPASGITLRRATALDAGAIRHITSAVHNNPMGLNWQHFVIATDQLGGLVGCGQVKLHRDGSQELASIAVQPGWRGNGIARSIIEQLLSEHPGTIYLTCRSELGPLYQRFGFRAVQFSEMSPYFRRLKRLVALFTKLTHQPDRMLVMKKNNDYLKPAMNQV